MPATRDGKTWRSQFYYEDWQGVRHKKNKRGFKTKAEAEEWERNFRQQQRKDLDINFENFVEIYFADVENRLRESTIKNKRYVFDLKVTPYFKKKKMCEIKTSDIRAWQNELIKQGYAPTYLKSINNQLAALFNYAVRYYDLKDNPCRKAGSIGKSKADDMEFWTKQEFKQFLPSMDKKPEARMAFMLLYWTGMRIGELLALTYEDIDLEKRIISICKSYQRLDGKDVITPPKTPKSNRKITIPPFLAEELKEYCSHLYGIMPNERMFRFTKSYMEHEIVRGIKETGVKRIRIHDLRHSHASLLVELGFQPLAIAERLGHEKIETTLNTYSHLYPNKQAELADVLDYSIRLGKLLRKTEEGKNLFQLEASIEEKYKGNDAFHQYEQFAEKKTSQYYFYSWDMAYKTFLNVLTDDSIEHRKMFIPTAELISSDTKIKELALTAKSFGNIFEQLVAVSISGGEYEEIIPHSWKYKIRNAISDVQIAVERTLLMRAFVR